MSGQFNKVFPVIMVRVHSQPLFIDRMQAFARCFGTIVARLDDGVEPKSPRIFTGVPISSRPIKRAHRPPAND